MMAKSVLLVVVLCVLAADVGGAGAGTQKWEFETGDSVLTSFSTADRITDFTTAIDKIDIGVTIGDLDLVYATNTFADFSAAASASFDSGSEASIYGAITDFGFAMVAIDADLSGDFGTGDILLRLDNINTTSDLVVTDFI